MQGNSFSLASLCKSLEIPHIDTEEISRKKQLEKSYIKARKFFGKLGITKVIVIGE